METLAVWTDENLNEQGALSDFTLDLAFGIGDNPENEFEIVLPDDIMLQEGCAIYIDGTPYGGIVYRRKSDTSHLGIFEWTGRTWHGVFADKVVTPPPEQNYYVLTGPVSSCINALIQKLDLGELFAVGECASGNIDYQFRRYQTGYKALFNMLESIGQKPTFSIDRTGGQIKVLVGSAEIVVEKEAADSELADVMIDELFIPYNHVVGLGEGTLQARPVVELFADENGVVSDTQTIFGRKERAIVYESSTQDVSDLRAGARSKLTELQQRGGVNVKLKQNEALDIGDYLVAVDTRIGAEVTVRVEKAIVKVENGYTTVDIQAGDA